MKKQKKPVKIDSNMVCYTRGQRFRGCVAFVGLLACGVMIGWGFGSAPAKKDDVVQSSCEVQLQQFAQKQAFECSEKVEAQRQQCNDMLATQAGAQEKKVNSSNDDVLILSSDKIDLTDAKIGTEKSQKIFVTANRPVKITDVNLRDKIDDLYVGSTCSMRGEIVSDQGCVLDVFYRPVVVKGEYVTQIILDWIDENGNTGKEIIAVNVSSVIDYDLDCVEKEELMLASLPNESRYDSLAEYHRARAVAYDALCPYCLGERASAYCFMKRDKELSKADMLDKVKNNLENIH